MNVESLGDAFELLRSNVCGLLVLDTEDVVGREPSFSRESGPAPPFGFHSFSEGLNSLTDRVHANDYSRTINYCKNYFRLYSNLHGGERSVVDYILMTRGDRIAQIRESKENLSQSGLARLAGISNDYMHKIESGKAKNVGIEVFERIAAALGVSLHDIIGPQSEPVKKEHPVDPESKLPDEEKRLLSEWRDLDDRDRVIVQGLMRQIRRSTPEGKKKNSGERIYPRKKAV